MFLKELLQWSAIANTVTVSLVLKLFSCGMFMAADCDCLKVNFAIRKRTFASSITWGHPESYAVDKDRSTYVDVNNHKGNPWFVVDLGRPYHIEDIILYQKINCPRCRGIDLVVTLLNDFDPDDKSSWKKDYAYCGDMPELETNKTKTMSFDCKNLTQYFRCVMVQSKDGKSSVVIQDLEVYGTDINYYGCYKKMEKIITPITYELQTNKHLSLCLRYCSITCNYAALEDKKCFCVEVVKILRPLSECDKLCGNKVDYCGGKEAYSVYKVNELSKLNHHCKDGNPPSMENLCKNLLCEDGWTGEACSMRDCSVHNGGCEHHTCINAKMPSGMTGECICNEGYDKQLWWKNCEDVNECKDNLTICNPEVCNCSNTIGSFKCICLDDKMGYSSTTNTFYENSTLTDELPDNYNKTSIWRKPTSSVTIGLFLSIILIGTIMFFALKSLLPSKTTLYDDTSLRTRDERINQTKVTNKT